MVNFGYPYNDIVICKDSTDYLTTYDVFNAYKLMPKSITFVLVQAMC